MPFLVSGSFMRTPPGVFFVSLFSFFSYLSEIEEEL